MTSQTHVASLMDSGKCLVYLMTPAATQEIMKGTFLSLSDGKPNKHMAGDSEKEKLF